MHITNRTVCLVGNPNCGKTTVFNALTGLRQEVGNWPGVTIERKSGQYTIGKDTIEVVDLPGIYSITASGSSGDDERVARQYLLSGEARAVINIIDASNLERNLYLTTQLLEMQVPVMLVVNMLDIAREKGLELDLHALSQAMGCPVYGVIASREDGIQELKKAIISFLNHADVPSLPYCHRPEIVQTHNRMERILRPDVGDKAHIIALHALEDALDSIPELSDETVRKVIQQYEELDRALDGDLDIYIAETRYQYISSICETIIDRKREVSHTITDRIDAIVLNRWLGLPIFMLIMYVMFLFTQNLGAAFIDFFDILVGGVMVDGMRALLETFNTPEWLIVFLADGIGGGLQTVATFIPVTLFLFLFLAVLEDSGYMARAAFVMDRLMSKLGLPGKAFVPLIVGFGCNVPAIMATRTLDRTNDRIITTLMAPFMSCGARLPVYVLFATAFFPHNGQNLVFGLYMLGIVAAILTGFLVKNVALNGDVSPFVMEIPPYHIPTLKGVFQRTWTRVKDFAVRAGQVIVVIVCILSFFNSLGTDGSFGNQDSDRSVLASTGRTITPILEPLGVQEENWPAAVGIFTGIFAKEAVVGTLNSLYSSIERTEATTEDTPEATREESSWAFMPILSEATTTLADNLVGLTGAFLDPMGITIGRTEDTTVAAEEQGVDVSSIGAMQRLFGSQEAAMAYLLLILLYMPCVAAVAAIYREVGTAWTVFAGSWCTVLGYAAATIYYRVATFATNPSTNSLYIGVAIAMLLAMMVWLRALANHSKKNQKRVIPIHSR